MRLKDQLLLLAGGKKYRKALQAGVSEHEALQAELEKKLGKVYNKYDRGEIDVEGFKHRFQRELVKGYESAFRAGKGEERLSSKDRRWIQSFSAKQFDYLEGFTDDLEAGQEPVSNEARVKLYGGTVRAAYWQGAVSEYDEPLDWVLNDNVQNCDDCIELADNSPYDPGDLPTVPGAGDTVCLGNCNCQLVTVT